jgi:hypothetical protein
VQGVGCRMQGAWCRVQGVGLNIKGYLRRELLAEAQGGDGRWARDPSKVLQCLHDQVVSCEMRRIVTV